MNIKPAPEQFQVQCDVCGAVYDNLVGSTPCCGSIAYMLDEHGNKKKEIVLFAKLNWDEGEE